MGKKTVVSIRYGSDTYYACNKVEELCKELEIHSSHISSIVIVVSELANNIIKYGEQGELIFEPIEEDGKKGVKIIAQDQGSGIDNWEDAKKIGYSTKNTLGLGLQGIFNLMDEVEYERRYKSGAKITAIKWI